MKSKTRKQPKRTPISKIKQAANSAAALDTSAAFNAPKASYRATGLAQMAMRLAGGKPPNSKAAVSQLDNIASAIDAALRIDRAAGEAEGRNKATEDLETAMVEGVLSRITMNALMSRRPVTIVLSFTEALVLKKKLEAAGYTDNVPRAHREAWTVATNDDAMHASLGRRAS